MSDADEYAGGGRAGGTRTRLPESETPRRPARPSRSLVTVVGVVVLLLAAIAFANRGGGDGDGDGGGGAGKGAAPGGADAAPTAPTGVRPVTGKAGTIPTGYAQDDQGAQSAASNYAVALGSDGMFRKATRHAIVDTVYTTDAAAKLKGPQDSAYSPDFLAKLGLDAHGNAPQGSTFVSRTIPVGTKVESYEGDTATVSVWYTGLIGMAGPTSTDPVSTTWKTWTFELQWFDGDWKITTDTQKDGPTPVPGDLQASNADEIANAVAEFGGFTYAR